MTLSFSTKYPKGMGELAGKPNYFVEKIWMSINLLHIPYNDEDGEWSSEREVYGHPDFYHSKRHTIREDPSDRWHAGRDIHFVINNRTKNRFQFAPVIKCVSVQKVKITHGRSFIEVSIEGTGEPLVYFGSNRYSKRLKDLAINDGFPSVEALFDYFNKDFTGKIIHWTDLKY